MVNCSEAKGNICADDENEDKWGLDGILIWITSRMENTAITTMYFCCCLNWFLKGLVFGKWHCIKKRWLVPSTKSLFTYLLIHFPETWNWPKKWKLDFSHFWVVWWQVGDALYCWTNICRVNLPQYRAFRVINNTKKKQTFYLARTIIFVILPFTNKEGKAINTSPA